MSGIELLAAATELGHGDGWNTEEFLSFVRLGEPSLSDDESV
jgi:hypothetical protein